MGAFGGFILTNKGRNLQVKAQTGVQLQFSRIGIGDGSLGSTSILELNALISEKKSLAITKLKVLADGKATVGTTLSNQDISSGFYFREIGVFATDPTEGEILYCYANAGATADYIPAGGGSDIVEKIIDVITIVGNASSVSAVINSSLVYYSKPAGGIPKADLDSAVQASLNKADSALQDGSKFALSEDLAKTDINVIDLAIELETMKGAVLTGVTANIFIETFQSLNDVTVDHGVYDSTNKRLVV